MSTRDSKRSNDPLPGLHKTTTCTVERTNDRSVELVTSDNRGFSLPLGAFPFAPAKGHRIKLRVAIEDKHTRSEWAAAYAQQGLSDLAMYREAAAKPPTTGAASCHALHYLQMATEKVAKAYTFKANGSLDKLLTSHVAAEEFVQLYHSSPEAKRHYGGQTAQLGRIKQEMRDVARKIEELAPAVDRERVPQNVEYPWSDGTKLHVPCSFKFPIEDTDARILEDFVKMLEHVAKSTIAA